MRKSLLKSVLTHFKNTLSEIFTTSYLAILVGWIIFVIIIPFVSQAAAFFIGLPLLCVTLYELSDPDYESPDDDSDFDGRA